MNVRMPDFIIFAITSFMYTVYPSGDKLTDYESKHLHPEENEAVSASLEHLAAVVGLSREGLESDLGKRLYVASNDFRCKFITHWLHRFTSAGSTFHSPCAFSRSTFGS